MHCLTFFATFDFLGRGAGMVIAIVEFSGRDCNPISQGAQSPEFYCG